MRPSIHKTLKPLTLDVKPQSKTSSYRSESQGAWNTSEVHVASGCVVQSTESLNTWNRSFTGVCTNKAATPNAPPPRPPPPTVLLLVLPLLLLLRLPHDADDDDYYYTTATTTTTTSSCCWYHCCCYESKGSVVLATGWMLQHPGLPRQNSPGMPSTRRWAEP